MITKRQLGIILIAAAMVGSVAIIAVDWLNAGQFSGIGPFQRLALGGAGVVFLIGLTLLPLGDRPA
ncbi:MAG: hypothetical protein R3300_22580 [Candidatus Promineifilaceae bacterium]|nr:hypothetical protein [Candidatus Promineifilaceae bacterium]